jgi:hypothetical protein
MLRAYRMRMTNVRLTMLSAIVLAIMSAAPTLDEPSHAISGATG